jgi:hypothetical protein
LPAASRYAATGWQPGIRVAPGDADRLTLVSSKELVTMPRLRLATALLAVLVLAACADSDHLTSPTGVLPGGTSGIPGTSGGDTTATPGDTTSNPIDTAAAGEPVSNGTWTDPDSTTIEQVDAGVYQVAETGTAVITGSSTALVFKTSGPGLFDVGTCGANGFWTHPDGRVFGPNNPNCLDLGSAGTPGPSLALTFPPQAQIFDATDGSGSRIMNFYSQSVVVAQLRYDGLTNTTVGAGILEGRDDATPANTWTIFFGQPALRNTTEVATGDLIDDLTGSGAQVVACSTPIGCSLVTLQLAVAP